MPADARSARVAYGLHTWPLILSMVPSVSDSWCALGSSGASRGTLLSSRFVLGDIDLAGQCDVGVFGVQLVWGCGLGVHVKVRHFLLQLGGGSGGGLARGAGRGVDEFDVLGSVGGVSGNLGALLLEVSFLSLSLLASLSWSGSFTGLVIVKAVIEFLILVQVLPMVVCLISAAATYSLLKFGTPFLVFLMSGTGCTKTSILHSLCAWGGSSLNLGVGTVDVGVSSLGRGGADIHSVKLLPDCL